MQLGLGQCSVQWTCGEVKGGDVVQGKGHHCTALSFSPRTLKSLI